MSLRSYLKENKNLTKLHKEISDSNTVSNFAGLFANTTHFSVLGDSILDESALDLVVANHDPVEVPETLTPRQIRLELLEHGITETDMDNLLNTLQSPTKEQALIDWKYALEFRRDNALLNQVAGMLNFTQEDVDHLFIDGATK